MKRSRLLIPVVFLMATSVRAQSVGPSTINATGGQVTIGSNEFEWSVGEMTLVNTFTGTGIIVTQGVLQPADVALGASNTNQLTKTLRVFPNPATDYVNVEYTSPANSTFSCKLLDIAGKEISNEIVTVTAGQSTTQVDVRSLSAATYMLEVTIVPQDGTPMISTYKIQKLR